ncbi:MAG: hypothetical protein ACLS7Z_12885 [Christensenellales bacterium]
MILREMAAMGLTDCETSLREPPAACGGAYDSAGAACGADVIALDEPFKGLDEATRARVIDET